MSVDDLYRLITGGNFRYVSTVMMLVVIFFVYKFLSRFISRAGESLELEAHAMNAVRLILRVVTVFFTLYVIFAWYNIPTTVFVSGSALVGALLGFGSSQTINNIVAGFYVLISQPFKVKDYVKIGDLEGQVEEISVNYTNLYTPTYNLLKVPNTQVMNSRILNLTHEGLIKYTFTVGFDHSVSTHTLLKECIEPAIDEFHEENKELQIRRPEVYVDSSDRLGKNFLIRIFIPKGEAKALYTNRPELLDNILEHWHRYKNT